MFQLSIRHQSAAMLQVEVCGHGTSAEMARA